MMSESGFDELALGLEPGRVWSLREMINRQIFPICELVKACALEEASLSLRLPSPSVAIPVPPAVGVAPPEFVTRVAGMFQFAKMMAAQFELPAVTDRVTHFEMQSRYAMRFDTLLAEIRVLRETIQDGLNYRYFYYYPQNRALTVLGSEAAWERVIVKFPSAKEDVKAGVDCWALDHATASIFHFMRVAEIGLRALAKERRVVLPKKRALAWADWQAIIEGIRKKVEMIAQRPRGPARDAALEFYRGALGSFEGFKDAYRNNVMHSRRAYAEADASAVMNHVRDFMNRLSERLDEKAAKQISWAAKP
jgi:hypothetical protein